MGSKLRNWRCKETKSKCRILEVNLTVDGGDVRSAFISRGLEYKSKDVMLRFIRPHLSIVSSFGLKSKNGCAGIAEC